VGPWVLQAGSVELRTASVHLDRLVFHAHQSQD
jgi:hypothetical protein